jgi:hypothetical protein
MRTQWIWVLGLAVAGLATGTPGWAGEATSWRFSDEDYARHVERLRGKLPSAAFHIVIEKPFVVVGDGGKEAVERSARGTVRWATRMLKKDYFPLDPVQIIDVWLFKDEGSYERHVEEIFGDTPGTPFGYYSPSDRALIMNISTGGGTLVHEMVHPFMEANFPDCPAWFNEGMGSLYEQCHEHEGRIRGLTNWRLAGLKREIRADTLPSLRELMALSDRAFYRGARGDNYAQARYLCYYLERRGLLRTFFRHYVGGRPVDPSGYLTLQAVLGEEDMEGFEERWRTWVLGLRFPER